jgi:hypothetical protein
MSTARVDFTRGAAERIARAVRIVEGGDRDGQPLRFGRVVADAPKSKDASVRIAKTTAQWTKGTVATIVLYEDGTPPNETVSVPTETLTACVNKFGTVGTNKWIALQRATNGYYYLIAAEC